MEKPILLSGGRNITSYGLSSIRTDTTINRDSPGSEGYSLPSIGPNLVTRKPL